MDTNRAEQVARFSLKNGDSPMRYQVILVVDDEPATTDALAMLLEASDRTIVTCNDIDSAKLVLARLPLSAVLSDVKFSGPFGFEGLEFVPHVSRHAPQTPVILMTGSSSGPLVEEARRRGAVEVIEKPFEAEQLEAILSRLPCNGQPRLPDDAPGVIRIPPFEEILNGSDLQPHFQPIISLAGPQNELLGFESVARFASRTPLLGSDLLFAYADSKGGLLELELTLIRLSLSHGAGLTNTGKLFMNVHPKAIAEKERFLETVTSAARSNGVPLDRIVFEITEQSGFADHVVALDCIDALRGLGVQFALDDLGIAYSHLAHIDRIKPAYLKVSQHFGTGCEDDETKFKIVRNILSLGADFDCAVVLEGIETPATAEFARRLGVPYGQGYLFGRPSPAREWINP